MSEELKKGIKKAWDVLQGPDGYQDRIIRASKILDALLNPEKYATPRCPLCDRLPTDFVEAGATHCPCHDALDPEAWMRLIAENTPCTCKPRYRFYPVPTDDGGFRCPECKRAGTAAEWYEQNKEH